MSKRRGKYKYELWEVRWMDAEGEAGWSDPKKPIEAVPCINLGFLISQTDDYIKLAAAYIDKPDDDQISSTDIIPKNMITSMTKLNVRAANGKKSKAKITPEDSGNVAGSQ